MRAKTIIVTQIKMTIRLRKPYGEHLPLLLDNKLNGCVQWHNKRTIVVALFPIGFLFELSGIKLCSNWINRSRYLFDAILICVLYV